MAGDEAAAGLEGLVERGMLRPASAPGEPQALEFHHVLLREAAYGAIAKRRRAELHERAADWLDRCAAGDEIVGHHLEQAARYRSELDGVGGAAGRLAVAAGERLGHAGIRAWRQADAPAATSLLRRAAALLPARHGDRAETLRELGSALWAVGEVEQADAVLAEAIAAAAAGRDRGLELRARVDLAYLRLFTSPEGRAAELVALAEEAIPVLETLRDHQSLGRTWLALASVYGGFHGRYAAGAEAVERALAHYEAVGWRPAVCVRELGTALYYGPAAVHSAIGRYRALLAGADRSSQATLWTFLAGLEAMRGRFAAARKFVDNARAAYDELGWSLSMRLTWAPVAADVEELAGADDRAAQVLLATCEELQRLDQRAPLATLAGRLAGSLYRTGRLAEAERWANVAERNAASDDVSAQIAWRGVRAKLLAREGWLPEAETVAQEAVAVAAATDMLNFHARSLLDLSEVRRVAGDVAAARYVEDARALYERKGNTAAARTAALRQAPARV